MDHVVGILVSDHDHEHRGGGGGGGGHGAIAAAAASRDDDFVDDLGSVVGAAELEALLHHVARELVLRKRKQVFPHACHDLEEEEE